MRRALTQEREVRLQAESIATKFSAKVEALEDVLDKLSRQPATEAVAPLQTI